MTILVIMFRTASQHSRDQNGPKWPILVHFGLWWSFLVHLGMPTILWPFLSGCNSEKRWILFNLETRYESNLVCPTKVLSQMRLSEGIPFKPILVLNTQPENQRSKPL